MDMSMQIIKVYSGDFYAGDNSILVYACVHPENSFGRPPMYSLEYTRVGYVARKSGTFYSKEEANEAFKKMKAEYKLKPVNIDPVAEANGIIHRYYSDWVKDKEEDARDYLGSNATEANIKAYILHKIADEIVLCAHMNDALNADFDGAILGALYVEYIARELKKNEEGKTPRDNRK